MAKILDVPANLLTWTTKAGWHFNDDVKTWMADWVAAGWLLERSKELSYTNAIRQTWGTPQGHVVNFEHDDDATLFALRWL